MRTFRELRNSIKSEGAKQSNPSKYPGQQLNEDNWLTKGYALTQSIRHSSLRQQIGAVLSNIRSLCDRGLHENDELKKVDVLLDILKECTRVANGFVELSHSTINVAVASTLLSEDFRKILASELEKIVNKR